MVQLASGERLGCITKGRKLDVACGDWVSVIVQPGDNGIITAVAPRTTLLYRADQFKQKTLAANATQMIVVLAGEPRFSDELLTRFLVAAEAAALQTLIVCNKSDLAHSEQVWQALEPLRAAGYRCLRLNARVSCDPLRESTAGHLSVLVGQSGMGKSTIINSLAPESNAATREISTALNAGKHTTTAAALYALDESSAIIDTPGLQNFGLAHLSAAQLTHAFPEFRTSSGLCRFRDCAHAGEPDCRLQAAVTQGNASTRRLALLRMLLAENKAHKHY